MSKRKQETLAGQQEAMETASKLAENHTAGAMNNNRNQKGHLPNSPSTG